MAALKRALGPHAKIVVLVVAYLLSLFAQTAGVDVGLDPSDTWQALGAAVLVWFTPNREAE